MLPILTAQYASDPTGVYSHGWTQVEKGNKETLLLMKGKLLSQSLSDNAHDLLLLPLEGLHLTSRNAPAPACWVTF